MFYTMNTAIIFAAASLVLVSAIVTVAMSNAVYATPPKAVVQYCLKTKSGFFCYSSETDCQTHLVDKNDKCFKRALK